MTERELRAMGVLLLAFLGAALVAGAAWRSSAADTSAVAVAPGREPVAGAASRPDDVRHLAIQPGWRAEQIANGLDRTGLGDGERFMQLVQDPQWAQLVGPKWVGVRTLEGYLYPGVYDVGPDFSEETLIRAMLERFDEAFTPAMVRRARKLHLTVAEVVTLASIIEREMVFESEAPVIAAVYRTRLRVRMPLQADPTVIYALESVENHLGDAYWARGLSPASLRFDSPFNTYRHSGLPPAPISSPRRHTLVAVLYPASFDYRYFVARGDNTHFFARTYQAHLRNIGRYRSRRELRPSSGTDLQRIVERVMQPVEAHTGVVVKNLATGELASANADEFFTAASLYKLAVLWKAFEERERGRLSFRKRIAITPEAAATDVPEIRARVGRRPTVAKALRQMIQVSSNAAGLTFLRQFGRRRIDRMLHRQGLRETSLSSMRLLTTPRDVARLLELVAAGQAVSPRASAEMLSILEGQRIGDRLPLYLPRGTRLAHKTGNIDYPSHDAGILFTRSGPVVIVAMTETPKNPAKATAAIAELGRVVYDYFEQYRPALVRADAVVRRACPGSPFRPAARGPLWRKTIVLDPGHGGKDPGARFRFRDGFVLREKDVVLDVAVRLKNLLVARGATVHMTRCRDFYPNRMTRAAFANQVAPDAFVSVHVNGSASRRKDGTELYYFHSDGRALANYLLGTFSSPALWETLSTKQTLPNRGVHRRQFDVLTFTEAPAALTESLFMTTPFEARLLRDTSHRASSRRQQIAVGHLRGLLNYFRRGDSTEEEEERLPTPPYRAPPRAEVTVTAVGDIAMADPAVFPPEVGPSIFAGVRRELAADLTLGNLEGVLAEGGRSKCAGNRSPSCFAFRASPSSVADLQQAGFDVLNLANNHSLDFGPQGAAETISALDRVGVLHTGRRGQVARLRVGPVRIAVVGFAPYPWAQSLLDLAAARRIVRRAASWGDLVLVTMHAGGEGRDWMHLTHGPEVYLGEPRGDPVAFAHAVVDAGADLVVGHGPHVLRGMEWYRGRLIAYSLGNFAGRRTLALGGRLGDGGILRVRLAADGTWRGGNLRGVRLVDSGRPVPDVSGSAVGLVRTLSNQDFGSRAPLLTSTGRISPSARPTKVSAIPAEPRLDPNDLTPREKAALLVVAGSPVPADAGGILLKSWNRNSERPRGALVFADQEGGPVKTFSDIPPWTAAAGYTDPAWAFREGRATGEALHWFGVHVNLAPVLDASTGPLGLRHFRRPSLALAFARGVEAGGTGACVKHFPGLGSTPVSTDVMRTGGVLTRGELARFRTAIRAGIGCVMVSHAVYPTLGHRPASLEPDTYRLLRRSGFTGVAITDDLDALGRDEAARSALLAVTAGADLVLFTSGADAERAIEALVPLARRGQLDVHVARVLRLRRAYGIPFAR